MTAYTATINGLDLGEGTAYRFQEFPQYLDPGQYLTARVQRQAIDGTRPAGPDVLPSRELVFVVQMIDTDVDAELLMFDLVAAFGPVRSGTIPFDFTAPGTALRVLGRPLGVTPSTNFTKYGKTLARCRFEATDPRLFSQTEQSMVLGLTGSGGFTFDLTFDLTFGTSGDNDGTATNEGTWETSWQASIAGPVTNPEITLGETGEKLDLDITVPAGSTLTLDQWSQSVLLNGSPRQNAVSLTSRWFTLAPGNNTIRYRAASGSGQMTLTWRSAWI